MDQVCSMLPGSCALPGFSLASDPWEDGHHLLNTAKSQLLLKAAGLRSSRAVQGQTPPLALPNVRELKNSVQFILQAWLELQQQVRSTWEISLARFSHSFKLIYGLGGHGYTDIVLNGNSALWSSYSPCKFSRLSYPFTKTNQVCVCSLCGKLIWLESNLFLFSESIQAVPVPLLGSPPSCESCCQGGSGGQWQQVVTNGEARIKLVKQLRQHYHQTWH